jgi:hypothetical protein
MRKDTENIIYLLQGIGNPKIESYLKSNDAWMLSLYLKPEELLEDKKE